MQALVEIGQDRKGKINKPINLKNGSKTSFENR